MAKVHSLHKMSGSHGAQTFYIRNGKQYSRRRTSLNKEKWYSRASMVRSRENALNFGAAGKAARAVWLGLHQSGVKHIAHYCYNNLTKRIHTALMQDETQKRARVFLGIQHVAAALGGVHLGPAHDHNALLRVDLLSTAEVAPGGDLLHPHPPASNPSPAPHARIAGLDLVAAALKPTLRPGTRLHLRLQVIYVPFAPLAFEPVENGHVPLYRHSAFPEYHGKVTGNHFAKVDTGWLPADGFDTSIRLPLPEKHGYDGSQTEGLWFIAIEWRAYTGRRFKNLSEFSTLALAGVQTLDEEDLPATLPATKRTPRAQRPHKPHPTHTHHSNARTHRRIAAHPDRPLPGTIRRQRARELVAHRLAQIWE